ncbi:anti-sigma factor [Mesobacillus foraminis]|uniref:Sigma factor regulator n=1 Tax=Mesobacillus foraminis TaxID=279826 RepID=A0A4R2BGH2_9BACI|nr:anti-sigma factor [Mesobacillus foraminis]TCN26147.1 sigma factor regulator [Mesobacillus foraminis]
MKDNDSIENRNNDDKLYKAYITNTKEEMDSSFSISVEEQRQIVARGRTAARITNVMISVAILLLILPVMTLLSYLYYAIGGRADHLIEVTSKTIYVTEPNISIEEMEIEDDIGFFSMNIFFDVYKRIGKQDYKAGDYDIYFALDQPAFPKKNMVLERPLPENPTGETENMLHPKANIPFSVSGEWNMLKGLPNGTVAEVYLSFSNLMDPEEIEEFLPTETEVQWLAVHTGLEAKQTDGEGIPIAPIGYPAQIDTTTWSPFNGRDQTNQEVFMDILALLEENEIVSEKVARAKSLDMTKRLAFLKANGIEVYGAVVTGPTPELRKLEQIEEIRAMKVGEVKLWNWK